MKMSRRNIGIIIVILVFALPLVFELRRIINQNSNDEYIVQNGINGTAEVLEAKQTGSRYNSNPRLNFYSW